jgi:RNA polymerase sigma-70 factor (ECF subfamily)
VSTPPASIEDPERTARIRARDPDTLQSVVREHLPMLLRAARAAGLSPDRADDAVQETLLTFVTRAHEFDGRARVRTWLYGILLKKTARAFESVRRSQETEEIDEIVEARFDETGRWVRPPRGPDAGADAERVRAWLADCLEGLPDRRRLAFVLREVEELPTEEVCKILEVTANNLGVLLFRARNGLRECLEIKGLRSRDDAEL